MKGAGEAVNGPSAGTLEATGAADTLLCARPEEGWDTRHESQGVQGQERSRSGEGETEDRTVEKGSGYKGKCTQLV